MTCPDGAPFVSSLPLLLDGDALVGHMARANPQWRHFGEAEALVVFHGPHAYVSPRWYTAPADARGAHDGLAAGTEAERAVAAWMARVAGWAPGG